jgi:hypothetical protein
LPLKAVNNFSSFLSSFMVLLSLVFTVMCSPQKGLPFLPSCDQCNVFFGNLSFFEHSIWPYHLSAYIVWFLIADEVTSVYFHNGFISVSIFQFSFVTWRYLKWSVLAVFILLLKFCVKNTTVNAVTNSKWWGSLQITFVPWQLILILWPLCCNLKTNDMEI